MDNYECLLWACKRDKIEVARVLLEKQKLSSTKKDIAVMTAITNNSYQALKLLFSAGFSLNRQHYNIIKLFVVDCAGADVKSLLKQYHYYSVLV